MKKALNTDNTGQDGVPRVIDFMSLRMSLKLMKEAILRR